MQVVMRARYVIRVNGEHPVYDGGRHRQEVGASSS